MATACVANADIGSLSLNNEDFRLKLALTLSAVFFAMASIVYP
jgi:hypothetical protein